MISVDVDAGNTDEARQRVRQYLRGYRITPTHQRVEIALTLLSKAQHVSAEQLLLIVNDRGARVSKATVYNTLGLFVRKGLVRAVLVDPSKVFYDSNTAPHHHLYDVTTGQLTDIEEQAVEIKEIEEIADGAAFEAVDVVVRVRSQAA